MLTLITVTWLTLLALAIGLWALSLAIKDASILDVFWGPACLIPAAMTLFIADVATPRATLITALVVIWGLRLAVHIGIRNLPHGEDYRYAYMRKRAGSDAKFAVWSLWRLFAFQATVAWFISLPVQLGQLGSSTVLGTGTGTLGALAWAGVMLFIVGLGFEAIGDYQLRAFKRDPTNQGKLMDRGLWSWTRHPNYFGDAHGVGRAYLDCVGVQPRDLHTTEPSADGLFSVRPEPQASRTFDVQALCELR